MVENGQPNYQEVFLLNRRRACVHAASGHMMTAVRMGCVSAKFLAASQTDNARADVKYL
jgi:hypothetical protein